jgi:hypothetical protein
MICPFTLMNVTTDSSSQLVWARLVYSFHVTSEQLTVVLFVNQIPLSVKVRWENLSLNLCVTPQSTKSKHTSVQSAIPLMNQLYHRLQSAIITFPIIPNTFHHVSHHHYVLFAQSSQGPLVLTSKFYCKNVCPMLQQNKLTQNPIPRNNI